MEEKALTMTIEYHLEAIFDLDQEKKMVRVNDIARRLDFKMPTETSMFKTLSKRNTGVTALIRKNAGMRGGGFACELQRRVDASDKKVPL